VLLIFRSGAATGDTPWYILLYGGLGISLGLWIWGRRVIETMGSDLTKITPSTGFTIEIGAATTVLLASKVGLPISTTHCKVGSVVMVGAASKSKQGVNWRLFGNIALTWVLTVPLTAIMAAAAMWLLKFAV
jgi:sodium-dependent phosphate transporter